jgi:hypothetical protein
MNRPDKLGALTAPVATVDGGSGRGATTANLSHQVPLTRVPSGVAVINCLSNPSARRTGTLRR